MKIIAVIPAFNEATHVGAVVSRARPFVDRVVAVDDGSADGTSEAAARVGATVLRHAVNRGLGAALGTGFAAARRLGADAVVTLDADGQHEPEEIPRFAEALREGADVVIGSRLLGNCAPMPWHRVAANRLGNLATAVLYGAWVTDSQSGFRALSRRALDAIHVQSDRMEVSSEIVAEARRHGLRLREIPIRAIYTEYSLSKGQGFFVGVKMLGRMVVRRLFE